MPPGESRQTLLLHDGELADVRAIVTELGTEVVEQRGQPGPDVVEREWDLVVASPQRLVELPPALSVQVRVAVLDKDSRTLRAMLHRAGIDLMVRRPVHPAALRLLLLHTLYRGPERRRRLRVGIGAAVQLRAGLRRRPAVLADLSHTGARLFTDHDLARGKKLKLVLPGSLTGGRGLPLSGQVVRTNLSPDSRYGRNEIAITFAPLATRAQNELHKVIAEHRRGPAMLDPNEARRLQQSRAPSDPPQTGPPPARAVAAAPAPVAASAPADEGAESDSDRRRDPRHSFERHIIALGVEAARVLMGRDISLGGMRVDREPGLTVGDRMQLALHVRAREEPLVVEAEIIRDDGEHGLVLSFYDLPDETAGYLARMVNFLPILAMREGEDGEAGVIVSEILDRRERDREAAAPAD